MQLFFANTNAGRISKAQDCGLDALAVLCLRINCLSSNSTRPLLKIYAGVPPEQTARDGWETQRVAREICQTLEYCDQKAYRECHSPASDAALEKALEYLGAHPEVRLLHPYGEDYPESLQEIPDRPIALFCKGEPARLRQPQIAIVGSRRATPPAQRFAAKLARRLSQAGVVVTSGLAAGCDLAAHRGACQGEVDGELVDIEPVLSIAVLGHGIDQVYPSQHRRIAEEIATRGGCLVTEFLPGTPPLAHNFPTRNRIIAGLARATIVVEAGLKSGSLISARLANEYGRDVFAVPGSPGNPLARGCHQLIKAGCHLFESVDDLSDVLGDRWPVFRQMLDGKAPGAASSAPPLALGALSPQLRGYLGQIGEEGMAVGEFAQACSVNMLQAQSILLDFEIQGLVRQTLSGKFYRLV